MTPKLIRVQAASLDTVQLTLYEEDGTTHTIPQGHPKLLEIVNIITPIVTAGGIAVVDIAMESMGPPTVEEVSREYHNYEKKSALTRFFRVAKDKLFGTKRPEEVSVRQVAPLDPREIQPPTRTIIVKAVQTAETLKIINAVEDIMKHAVPAADPSFTDGGTSDVKSVDTVIAVVTNQVTGVKTVIPDVQKLRNQISRAAKLGSTKAVDAFMARIAPVMKDRRHSIEDLLIFMERGDLPIAEDGCIIIYKVLDRHPTQKGYHVDKHSKKVPQRIGSYVFMNASLVDHDRRTECSNGLHVARRKYISGFRADDCFLAKVKPEDVIAVPEADADKMRVCGYHLIMKLSPQAYEMIQNNRPFTSDSEAQLQLSRAVSGEHPPVDQLVEIRGAYGSNILVTDLTPKVEIEAPEPAPVVAVVPIAPIKLAEDYVEEAKEQAPSVDPTKVAREVAAVKTEVAGNQRSVRAVALFDEVGRKTGSSRISKAKELLDFKKSAKVSWEKLGLAADTGDALKLLISGGPAVAPTKIVMAPAGSFTSSEKPGAKAASEVLVKVRQSSVPIAAPSVTTEVPKNRFELAQELARNFKGAKSISAKKEAALSLWSHKRRHKLGWSTLGVPGDVANAVETIVKDAA